MYPEGCAHVFLQEQYTDFILYKHVSYFFSKGMHGFGFETMVDECGTIFGVGKNFVRIPFC